MLSNPDQRTQTPAQRAAQWLSLEEQIQNCRVSRFITLTTRRRYDEMHLSHEVSEVLRRSNRKYFGTAYERHGVCFITYVVHERTINQGLHAHMLLGVPDDWGRKANPCLIPVSELIIGKWLELDTPRYRTAKAQDARAIYDHPNLLGYVRKDIQTFDDLLNVDVMNIHTFR